MWQTQNFASLLDILALYNLIFYDKQHDWEDIHRFPVFRIPPLLMTLDYSTPQLSESVEYNT